jgi:ketosteroid isomerase-like protein
VLDRAQAKELVDRWLDARNRHDLDAVMAMCADDIEFVSPFLAAMYDTPSGVLRGKDALRGWFAQSLENPDFHIDPPLHVLTGVDTFVLVERIHGVVAANVFTVGPDGRFTASRVHA